MATPDDQVTQRGDNAAYHAMTVEQVMRRLGTSVNGLSGNDVALRLSEHGPNALPEPPRPSVLRRLLAQFSNVLIGVLLLATAVTALLGHWVDTVVIASVVLINAAIGFVQEGRAEAAIGALRNLLAPRATVTREGRRQTVPAEQLVPGDCISLESGDRVPADMRLVQVSHLTIEEALLTGESVPVRKAVIEVAPDAVLGDRTCMAYSGTLVVEGTATGVVIATGIRSELGRISRLLGGVLQLTTPLVRQMERFARGLTGFLLLVALAVFGFATLIREMPAADVFMIVVSLFVAAIPEGLPAVLTIALAAGVQVMAAQNAIVRRLPSIETLGAISVICSDKTGTLTRNEMQVVSLVTADGTFAIGGEGYSPVGDIDGAADPELVRAAGQVAALCNNAALACTDGEWFTEGDPMEGALLAFAAKCGANWKDRPTSLASLPFDAAWRYMAVLHDIDNTRWILLKGAPEQVLEACASEYATGSSRPVRMVWWHAQADVIASRGQRVLALARKQHDGDSLGHPDVRHGLELLALIGLLDPPRPEAITAVTACRAAGIDVKMITGDHRVTAAAIGQQIGLNRHDSVLVGAEIDALDDDALAEAVSRTDVFARTSPEHKLRLVNALQSRGAVVAMTGDGVNDAPALKRADVGIAMGLKGSEAAREAAAMVLADDNFASIVEAVRRGRTVYANLRKVVSFLLPINGGESISLIVAVLLGIMLPITPLQILWINMVSSVALALPLAFEPPERLIMHQRPRRADEPILSRFILWRVILVSTLFAAGIFGQFEWALLRGADVETARTMAVNTLVALEVAYLFAVRYQFQSPFTLEGLRGTRPVLIALGAIVLMQSAFTWLPALQSVFGTRDLTAVDILLCATSGLVLLVVIEVDRLAARGWKRLFSRGHISR